MSAVGRVRLGWATLAGTALLLVSCSETALGPMPTPPTCSNPDVLTFVADHYKAEVPAPELVAGSAAQYPTAQANLLSCSVYVRRAVYDTPRYGSLPKIVMEPRFFHVKALAHGFEVTFVPLPGG